MPWMCPEKRDGNWTLGVGMQTMGLIFMPGAVLPRSALGLPGSLRERAGQRADPLSLYLSSREKG